MAKLIINSVNIDGIRNHLRAYKDMETGELFQEAAQELTKRAYIHMEKTYQEGRKHYKRRPKTSGATIENTFFIGPSKPRVINNSTIEISVVDDWGEVNRKLEHLQWVEEGTRTSWTDMQPYLIGNQRYWSISKIAAANRKKVKYRRRPLFRDIGSVSDIKVVHRGQRGRHFIKAFNSFIKINGEAFVSDYIRSKMRERYDII